jgi:hypothetical protein
MLMSSTLRRLLAVTTAVSIVLPAGLASAQDDTSGATPPTRVGEIAAVTGGVSFNGAGTGGWAAASLNYPVSAGDSVYTQPGGQAVLALDASTITLAESTELQITGLSETTLGATAAQGEVFLDIESLAPGDSYSIATPRGTVTISQNGKYDIAAGDQANPTIVNVFDGAATVTDPGATVQVAAGQAASLTGTDQTVATLGQAQPDVFAQSELARTAPPPPADAPPVVAEMTGGAQLAQYGSWNQDPDYGDVWYPSVDAGWAPYREGYWADVQPWGYTWVDSEPWGFAPFHYGRWIDHGGRWGWIPVDRDYRGDDRPVYAPALVTFFGVGIAAGITIGALGNHSIGWVPLGPGEVFRPYYHASEDYDRRINAHYVRDLNGVDFRTAPAFAPEHFADRRGATYIDAGALGRGAPVARFGHPVGQDAFAAARPIGADVRLPRADVPLARLHPAEAPHPTAFAERHDLPRAVVANRPDYVHPGLPPPGRIPAVIPARPGFGGNPGYHPPPPPPGFGGNDDTQHLPQVYNQGGNDFHPQSGQPHLPQVYRPQDQGLPPLRPLTPQHQQLPQVYRPDQNAGQPLRPDFQPPNAARPPLPQVFHPESQPRPPEPQPFHPQFQPPPAFHPQPMEQPHFEPPPQPHFNPPDQRPAPPPQDDRKKPGQQ